MSTFTDRQYAHDLIERLDSSMVVTAEEEQAIRRLEAWFDFVRQRELIDPVRLGFARGFGPLL